MVLSKKALKALKENPALRNLIAASCEVSERSIQRWIQNNDRQLTMADSLRVIRLQTKMKDSEILTNN